MLTDTEAIVLRQVKTVNGRRMLLLFSQKYGKISVGSNLTESGKNKSALPQRPFSYGRYELFKGRESYNLNRGQVIKSYYGIGEDLDKYMAASWRTNCRSLRCSACFWNFSTRSKNAAVSRKRWSRPISSRPSTCSAPCRGSKPAASAARQERTDISASKRAA